MDHGPTLQCTPGEERLNLLAGKTGYIHCASGSFPDNDRDDREVPAGYLKTTK